MYEEEPRAANSAVVGCQQCCHPMYELHNGTQADNRKPHDYEPHRNPEKYTPTLKP